MVAESIKLQSFLRFQEQLRVRKDGNRRWDKELNGIVYIHYMYTEWQSGKWIERGGGEDTGAIKTKKMEGKSNQTERH